MWKNSSRWPSNTFYPHKLNTPLRVSVTLRAVAGFSPCHPRVSVTLRAVAGSSPCHPRVSVTLRAVAGSSPRAPATAHLSGHWVPSAALAPRLRAKSDAPVRHAK